MCGIADDSVCSMGNTQEDKFGDFGPVRMTPDELDEMYRQLPPVAFALWPETSA